MCRLSHSRAIRLLTYLLGSYLVSYVAHIPVHGGFINPLIAAAVPWAIPAALACWCVGTGRSLRPAWIALAASCTFVLLVAVCLPFEKVCQLSKFITDNSVTLVICHASALGSSRTEAV